MVRGLILLIFWLKEFLLRYQFNIYKLKSYFYCYIKSFVIEEFKQLFKLNIKDVFSQCTQVEEEKIK